MGNYSVNNRENRDNLVSIIIVSATLFWFSITENRNNRVYPFGKRYKWPEILN